MEYPCPVVLNPSPSLHNPCIMLLPYYKRRSAFPQYGNAQTSPNVTYGKTSADGSQLEAELTGLRHAGLTTPLFAGLFVILPRLQDLQNPFAFHLLLQALQGPLKRLVISNVYF